MVHTFKIITLSGLALLVTHSFTSTPRFVPTTNKEQTIQDNLEKLIRDIAAYNPLEEIDSTFDRERTPQPRRRMINPPKDLQTIPSRGPRDRSSSFHSPEQFAQQITSQRFRRKGNTPPLAPATLALYLESLKLESLKNAKAPDDNHTSHEKSQNEENLTTNNEIRFF
jgi:hypothetical protein